MDKQNFHQKLVILMICTALILSGSTYTPVYGKSAPSARVKVALVYTITTPELKADVVREVRKQLGENVEILSYEDPSVFTEIRDAGYVTATPAARLIGMYMKAIEDGAEAILSICSTVGDVAYNMQDAAAYLGVPIVLINEEMCREAVRQGKRIAIMATFPTAVAPTRNTLTRVAREMGKQVEVMDVLVDGGFGLDQDKFKALMAAKVKEIAGKTDVILFAQGSMAYCEEYIAGRFHKVVFSNPRFGAKALKDALTTKGIRLD